MSAYRRGGKGRPAHERPRKARAVWAALSESAVGGVAWVGVRELEARTGLCSEAVKAALRDLEAGGMIACPRPQKNRLARHVRVLVPLLPRVSTPGPGVVYSAE